MSDRRSVGFVALTASVGLCAPAHAQDANQSSTLPQIPVDNKRPAKKPERLGNGTPAAATPPAPGPPPAASASLEDLNATITGVPPAEDAGDCAPGASGSCNDVYLQRQTSVESNARSYPRRLPIALVSGRGIMVRDADGREYIDCLAGAGALVLGHNHHVVVEAIKRALDAEVPLQTLDLPTPLKDRFTQTLFESLPTYCSDQFKIHFCGPSGADAIEAALKLARTATGRKGVIAFDGAYHGMTQSAMGLMGDIEPKTGVGASLVDVQFMPFPSEYRCPFGLGSDAGAMASANYLERLLEDPHAGAPRPAAIILEIVQGEGGVNPAPDGWLRRVREIASRHRALLIVDEVQTGLGRTGRLYAFEHAGIVPDILVLSKAIGGGLPLAVILYRRDLDVWRPGAHAGTFRGNQLAFAAGSAAIKHVMRERLEKHAELAGERLQKALECLAEDAVCIGHVRGRGLMRGVEICARPDRRPSGGKPPPPAPDVARRLQQECLRRGLIVELGGRSGSVARFLPPLIVSLSEIEEIAGRFGEAVKAAETSRLAHSA
jgi:diaminobutyrate-2-oxoglutarate transaminase